MFKHPNALTGKNVEELAKELAKIAHDLRTPLAIIKISNNLLERNHLQFSEDRVKWYLERIASQTNEMIKMIDAIERLSRVGLPDFDSVPLSLNQEMPDIVAVCQARWKETHSLNYSGSDDEIVVKGDVKLLNQIVSNLVQFAIRQSPNADRIDIELFRQDDTSVIRITDYGMKIGEEDIATILEPQFGLGRVGELADTLLGLAPVKTAVALLDGSLEVVSDVEAGTSINVLLPCV